MPTALRPSVGSGVPLSTLAALAVYAGRDITLIVGGYDRGNDYGKLLETLSTGAAKAIICLGETAYERNSGQTLDVLKRELAGSVPDDSTPESTGSGPTRVVHRTDDRETRSSNRRETI